MNEKMISVDKFFRDDLVKYVLRMHMSRLGKLGGLSRSEAKKKACRLNAQKRWSQPRQAVLPGIITGAGAAPSGGVISSNTPPPSSHVQE